MRKKKKPRKLKKFDTFDFPKGRRLARKYEVTQWIGTGWEGEVYRIRELETGVERAAKIFFPHRNPRNRVLKFYAKKLHKLRHCPIFIQYHTQESFFHYGQLITFLVSELVEGELLSEFLKRQPGSRLNVFQGLHLLYALASGLEPVHRLREYHGDLHTENIMICRLGLRFDLKIFDPFHWQDSRSDNINDDVTDLIKIFYDAIGGAEHYHKHPRQIKDICCGLKRSLILSKYRTAGQLRQSLETMEIDFTRK